jgi:peroxiredoxin
MTAQAQAQPSLKTELDQLTADAGMPAEVGEAIARASLEIEASGLVGGLAVGETAPGFSLPNPVGRIVSLAERLAAGPVVVSFNRGSWCPYCNLELRALQRALPEIRNRGASLIAITPEAPDGSLTLAEKHALTFDLLTDAGGRVALEWRLRYDLPTELRQLYLDVFKVDLGASNAEGEWNLPVPGTFVLDPAGVVRARHVAVDFTSRMEPSEIIEALAALPGEDR